MALNSTLSKIRISNLEMHAWHACNLHCESCSHYSSVGLRGGPSAYECISWMKAWADRLEPVQFSIVGGEPAANLELCEIIEAAIRFWPSSRIRLVSNGFLLHRHPRLPKILTRAADHVLVISSHHGGTSYQQRFESVRKLLAVWSSEEHINYRIAEAESMWTRRYRYDVTNSSLYFFSSNPKDAWRNCAGKYCVQLYDGHLWKCPVVAYLGLASARASIPPDVELLLSEYRALQASCSDAALLQFLSLKNEQVCTICPSSDEYFPLGNPLRPIRQ